MTEILYETALTSSDAVRIDREAGVIFGVKIIGSESRNGRHYPNATLQEAIPLYENSKVNLDHPDGDPGRPRSYHARFGMIRNVHLREDEGLFADFWFNPKHAIAEQLLWDAEHAPDNVGFSHNVEAKVNRKSEPVIVEQIVAVRSVDLVADPASTQGLFESVCSHLNPPPKGEKTSLSPLSGNGLGREQPITIEQVEHLIEERLRQLQRESKPQCREQICTESTFDSKSFAAVLRH